jgi:hypothetical protein
MLNNILNGWRPLTTKIVIISFLLYIIVKSIPALAAGVMVDSKWNCGTSIEVGAALIEYGEEVIATGAVEDMFIMTFWVNRETRSWTIVLTDNKDKEVSCVVAYGTKLKTIALPARVSI